MKSNDLFSIEEKSVNEEQFYKASRHLHCILCDNDNLIHGFRLAKADSTTLFGGPGQEPKHDGQSWAMYYCPECEGYFPYPKPYPTDRRLQALYTQILQWSLAKAKEKKEFKESIDRVVSILKASKDMPGLPGGLEDDATLETMLKPFRSELDKMWSELKKRKGGRPKGSLNKPKPIL